eukprot:gene17068-20955_t
MTCWRKTMFGLVRRDIGFLRRVQGRSCLVVADESPFPPGADHQEQFHVGHITFVWVKEVEDEELGTIARCQAYTAAIFFADSAAAKELLRALDDVMTYLIDVSRVLRDQRVLDKATPRMSRCPILA